MDSRKLDWALLRGFLAVIDTGSLMAAARLVGSYQPTLSRQIAALEFQLGVPLFERTGRGLVPTAAGQSIVAAAREMADAAKKVEASIHGARAVIRGKVRIACSEVAATYLMPRVIVALRRRHPEIQVELVASNAVSNLLRREADIALRLVRPNQSSLVARKIAEMSMGAFAALEYLVGRMSPSTAADLLHHELVGLDNDDSLLRALKAAGVAVGRGSFAVRTDDQGAGIRLVQAGAGIGFMPHYVAQQLSGLEEVLASMPAVALPVWLVVHREIRGSAIVRAAYDFLAKDVPLRLAHPLKPPAGASVIVPPLLRHHSKGGG